MGPSPVPQGPWWSWGIGEQCKWWLERMEDGVKSNGGGDGGLRFSLQFDPGKLGLDRALLGLPVSALLGHLLGWSSQGASMAVAEGGGEGETAAGVAALASAFAVYLVATYASDHRRQPQQPRRPLRLRKRDLSPLNSCKVSFLGFFFSSLLLWCLVCFVVMIFCFVCSS